MVKKGVNIAKLLCMIVDAYIIHDFSGLVKKAARLNALPLYFDL